MLLSCQTLDVLHAFYIFFGTNLLTYCQVPVPVFFHVFEPFQRRILNGVQTERNFQKVFFQNRRRSGSLRIRTGGQQGPHKPPSRGQGGPRLSGLWAPWATSALGLSPIYSLKSQKNQEIIENTFSPPQASVSARSHLGYVLVPH